MPHLSDSAFVGPTILDHICNQFAEETARYAARITAHHAAMRKHVPVRGESGPDHFSLQDRLLQEAADLLTLHVTLAGTQSEILERQARSIRLLAALLRHGSAAGAFSP